MKNLKPLHMISFWCYLTLLLLTNQAAMFLFITSRSSRNSKGGKYCLLVQAQHIITKKQVFYSQYSSSKSKLFVVIVVHCSPYLKIQK